MSQAVTNKAIYEGRLPDGTLAGQLNPRDFNRLADTLAMVVPGARSLLDIGCGYGDWLHYVLRNRPLERHIGTDVATNKIEEGRRRYPELNLRDCFAEDLQEPDGAYDVVTSLEVLEHIPDWQTVFRSLFRFAARQVIVTVPYREKIQHTVCIHCAQLTPFWGHLHSFREDTFPEVPGWRKETRKLKDRDPTRPLEWRLYRAFKPFYPWLLVSYTR